MRKIYTLLASLVLAFLCIAADGSKKPLKPIAKLTVHGIAEPSDVCRSPQGKYYMVSDNGYAYETDSAAHVLKKLDTDGADFEGVFADDQFVYVVQEMNSEILKVNQATNKVERIYSLPYHGPRNKGFESITFIPDTKHFLMVTERDPIIIFEMDENFNVLKQTTLKKYHDISSATYHNGKLYLLSDEDRCVLVMNPVSFDIEKTYHLNILNPEGIAFDGAGHMMIVSDDLAKLFYFNLP
jgi:uncharacterized protein YjiK